MDRQVIGWAMENPAIMAALDAHAAEVGPHFEIGFMPAEAGLPANTLAIRPLGGGEGTHLIYPDGRREALVP